MGFERLLFIYYFRDLKVSGGEGLVKRLRDIFKLMKERIQRNCFIWLTEKNKL